MSDDAAALKPFLEVVLKDDLVAWHADSVAAAASTAAAGAAAGGGAAAAAPGAAEGSGGRASPRPDGVVAALGYLGSGVGGDAQQPLAVPAPRSDAELAALEQRLRDRSAKNAKQVLDRLATAAPRVQLSAASQAQVCVCRVGWV